MTNLPLRIGYADPPYPGCAHLYSDHEDYAGEVDHAELVERLERDFDGWVLHTSSVALRNVLPLCPSGVRVMSWVKPFAAFKRNVSVAYAWEPVIVKAARKPMVSKRLVMRDWLAENITMKRGLTGAKPQAVCWWLFEVLGAEPNDEFHDLYPGTGAVSRAWDGWRRLLALPNEFQSHQMMKGVLMDTDQIMEYAQAVQKYKSWVDEHASIVGDAQLEVSRAAGRVAEAEAELREVIERLGSDPMNVLKKQRVRVTDDQRAMVLRDVEEDGGTEAEIAKDTGLPIEVVRLSLRHLSRIGKVKKDGRGASAVWSASTPKWSEQTAPSIADKVNALLVDEVEPERLEGVFRTGGTENHDEVPF